MIFHKSWGSLASDLVKVTVETSIVPGEGKSEGVAVRMEPEGVRIDFTLETGRRTESVSEAELAMVDRRMNVAQQAVNRNATLWRLIDDGVLGQATEDGGTGTTGTGIGAGTGMGTGTATTGTTATPIVNVTNPSISDYLYGSRYVGYAPQITLVDVGTELYMPPVAISPDRRYVLMNISQSFNTLVAAPTYGTGIGGGTGGGGMVGGMGGGGMEEGWTEFGPPAIMRNELMSFPGATGYYFGNGTMPGGSGAVIDP